MSLQQYRKEYKTTLAAYKDAQKCGDEKTAQKLAHDLAHLADMIESES